MRISEKRPSIVKRILQPSQNALVLHAIVSLLFLLDLVLALASPFTTCLLAWPFFPRFSNALFTLAFTTSGWIVDAVVEKLLTWS